MKLLEALEILKRPAPAEASPFSVLLACGFTPLHLKTFLAAELSLHLPARRVEISDGLFGDLSGTLENAARTRPDAVAVALEWQDLDPRLGIRTLGGWRHENIPDIVDSAHRQMDRVANGLQRLEVPVALSLPTLPLPPLFSVAGEQVAVAELRLRESLISFAAKVSVFLNVRIVSSQRLDELSPLPGRFDARSEIAAGFPYKNSHASLLAEMFATLIQTPSPKKGLITDLDDTFWAGILGEVGVEGVAWDLEHHAQPHGIYQQFLNSLASVGVLLAVASKNDAGLVTEAFLRRDLLCPSNVFFPVEAHWSAKSESVARILKAWNIGADAVVFIDDSPMEAAEVKAAYPEMQCLAFPRNDPAALWKLLEQLRDMFGKSVVAKEDALRLDSLRAARQLEEAAAPGGANLDQFLADAEAKLEFSVISPGDERALQLVNKTNQFNLNGKRWEAAEWTRYLADPEAFSLAVTYSDKFGPLGKIAALIGKREGKTLRIDAWVMSCRAFSRRIEHQTLRHLFGKYDASAIAFDLVTTPRNGPVRELLTSSTVTREEFESKCPPLFHEVEEVNNA